MKSHVLVASASIACTTLVPLAVLGQPTAAREFNAEYHVCHTAAAATRKDRSEGKHVGPGAVIRYHLASHNIAPAEVEPAMTFVADGPQHGLLQAAPDGSYLYRPDANYKGRDEIVYVFEARGMRLKVISTVWVTDTAAENDGCRQDHRLSPAE